MRHCAVGLRAELATDTLRGPIWDWKRTALARMPNMRAKNRLSSWLVLMVVLLGLCFIWLFVGDPFEDDLA